MMFKFAYLASIIYFRIDVYFKILINHAVIIDCVFPRLNVNDGIWLDQNRKGRRIKLNVNIRAIRHMLRANYIVSFLDMGLLDSRKCLLYSLYKMFLDEYHFI